MEWAGSCKRRYARVLTVVLEQLEGKCDVLHWMPAHTSNTSIGQKLCSDGVALTDVMWASNQLVDLLAKQAAEMHRCCGDIRRWLIHRDKQMGELATYVGRLTYAANHFVNGEGKIARDADPMPARKRKRGQKPTCTKKPSSTKTVARSKPSCADGDFSWSLKRPSGAAFKRCGTSKQNVAYRIESSIAKRQEAAFQRVWRENRELTLQPRDASLPSASSRREALRMRLKSRQGS